MTGGSESRGPPVGVMMLAQRLTNADRKSSSVNERNKRSVSLFGRIIFFAVYCFGACRSSTIRQSPSSYFQSARHGRKTTGHVGDSPSRSGTNLV